MTTDNSFDCLAEVVTDSFLQCKIISFLLFPYWMEVIKLSPHLRSGAFCSIFLRAK